MLLFDWDCRKCRHSRHSRQCRISHRLNTDTELAAMSSSSEAQASA